MEAEQPSEPEHQKEYASTEATGRQPSLSVQAKIVNSNAMENMFVVFTMVQQIMTEFSYAASEEEKVSVITKVTFSLLKRNGSNSS
jgi:hypothetical protein